MNHNKIALNKIMYLLEGDNKLCNLSIVFGVDEYCYLMKGVIKCFW